MNKFSNKIFLSTCALIVLWSLFSWISYALSEKKRFHKEILNLPTGESVGLERFSSLKNYTDICILHPYAIESGEMQQKSLDNIFGEIRNYDLKQILKHHTLADGIWSFYLVKDKVVQSTFNNQTPLLLRSPLFFEISRPFRAGCYKLSDVCFTNQLEKPYIKKETVIHHCE